MRGSAAHHDSTRTSGSSSITASAAARLVPVEAAVAATTTRRELSLTPRLRKLALTPHVTCSVGWLGAAVSYLVLTISALRRGDSESARTSNPRSEAAERPRTTIGLGPGGCGYRRPLRCIASDRLPDPHAETNPPMPRKARALIPLLVLGAACAPASEEPEVAMLVDELPAPQAASTPAPSGEKPLIHVWKSPT